MLFGGTIFTSSVVGWRIQSVKCEKCGTSFFYKLVRAGIGKGSAAYTIGMEQAISRSQIAAQRDLEYRLNSDVELVACPHCHWVNHQMVEDFRSQKYNRGLMVIMLVMIIGLFAIPIIGPLLIDNNQWAPKFLWILTFCLFSLPLWYLVATLFLRRRINPNVNYPEKPTLPAGTPPPLVEQIDPNTGEKLLTPVPFDQEYPSDGVIFRPGQIQPPDSCCRCLSTPNMSLTPPTKYNKYGGIAIPICKACLWSLRFRRFLLMLMFIAASWALVGKLLQYFQFHDDGVRTSVYILIESILSVIACFLFAHLTFRPYRIHVIDKERGILRISAINPQYTSMLIEKASESDRHTIPFPHSTFPASTSCSSSADTIVI